MNDAREFAEKLGGRWFGSYGTAPCPVCQTEKRKDQNALTIGQGSVGMMLHCKKSSCDFAEILRASDIAPFQRATPQSDFRPTKPTNAGTRARQIWREAVLIKGTPAETYLRARAITCELSATLRFHASCSHPSGVKAPAMVALVEGGQGFAVHRTYLDPDGDGKAALDPPKAMLGKVAGGAVRLSSGAGPLVAAEGIETALSLLSGPLAEPATVWAALSTSGLRGLRLPETPGELIIAPDGDRPGKKAAIDLATKAHALGWKTRFMMPPEGRDWNDVLAGKGAAT